MDHYYDSGYDPERGIREWEARNRQFDDANAFAGYVVLGVFLACFAVGLLTALKHSW